MFNTYLALLLLTGFIVITLIDTVGAIASRKFHFRYTYLSLLSFALYISLGYFLTKEYGFGRAVLFNGVLGLYDGTIGLWFSLVLRANNGITDEQAEELLGIRSAFIMIITTSICTAIGYSLTFIG